MALQQISKRDVEARERRTIQKKMGDTKDESQKTGNNGKGSNKALIILGIVVGIILIALLIVVIVLLLKKNDQSTAPTNQAPAQEEKKREVLVTEENVEEVISAIEEDEYVPQGYYTVTQNYEWHFPKGDAASTDAHVENLTENTNDVYFDLFLADDQENPIYQSPVIPLGAALEKFKLDTALDAGTYDCIIVYHLIDENQNSLSTVSMTVTVIVEG
jgi:tetrahydromethanopterin S-methyltransferase subunit G